MRNHSLGQHQPTMVIRTHSLKASVKFYRLLGFAVLVEDVENRALDRMRAHMNTIRGQRLLTTTMMYSRRPGKNPVIVRLEEREQPKRPPQKRTQPPVRPRPSREISVVLDHTPSPELEAELDPVAILIRRGFGEVDHPLTSVHTKRSYIAIRTGSSPKPQAPTTMRIKEALCQK